MECDFEWVDRYFVAIRAFMAHSGEIAAEAMTLEKPVANCWITAQFSKIMNRSDLPKAN